MQWYDENSGAPALRQERYRKDLSRLDKSRPRQRYDDDCFGYNSDVELDLKGHVHAYEHGDDEGTGLRGGDSGRRRRPVGSDAEAAMANDDNTAVLRLLEEALTKYSARRRRPSTAHVALLERSAALKTRMFGPESSATRKALRDTIVACNSLAMSALGRGNTSRCKDILARAFEMASDPKQGSRTERDTGGGFPALQVLTLNNTACLHRRLGEPKRALRYLRRAAKVGRESNGSEHLEVTHLNACAVLSELGRHEEALEHARSAVFHGQEREGVGARGNEERLADERTGIEKNRQARLATLAVSYYNLAVELEYTRRYEACLRWYYEAVKLARDPDVQNEALIKTFQRSYAGARKKHAPCLPWRASGGRDPAASKPSSTSLKARTKRTSSSAARKTPPPVSSLPSPSSSSNGACRSTRWRRGNTASPSPPPSHACSHESPVYDEDYAASPESFGSGREVASRPTPEFCDSGGRSQHVEWPHLGRVERQRAGDERRSKEASSSSRNTTDQWMAAARPSAATSSTPDVAGRNKRVVQCSTNNVRGESAFFRASPKPLEYSNEWISEERQRPNGGGGSSNRKGPELRKRPASAEVSREHQREQCHLDKTTCTSSIPEASGTALHPLWQPLWDGGGLIKSSSQPNVEEMSTANSGSRPHTTESRRPKSAYPRLEDRGRPDDTMMIEIRVGGGGRASGAYGDARFSSTPSRSVSAPAVKNTSTQATLPMGRGDNLSWGGGGAPTGGCGRKRMLSAKANSVQQRKHSVRTGLKRTRSDNVGDVVGSVHGSIGRSDRSVSLPLAADVGRPRWRPSMQTLRRASTLPIEPVRSTQRKGQVQAKPRGVDGSASRGRDGPSPRTSSTCEEQQQVRRESRLDNGRDGKLYLDFEPEETQDQSIPCGDDNNQGANRDRQTHEKEAKAETEGVSATEAVVTVNPVKKGEEEGEVQKRETADKAQSLTIESRSRAEAAEIIWRAVVSAVIERRPSRVREGTEKRQVDFDTVGTGKMGSDVTAVSPDEAGSPRAWVPTETKLLDCAALDDSGQEMASAAPPEVSTSITVAQNQRCNLGRPESGRRVIAGSTIRVWIARVLLTRQLQRKRVRHLKVRWEREVHRIAATHIQALARGMTGRRECRRAAQAAVEVQRVTRGRQGRSAVKKVVQQRLEEHGAASEKIQRQFRGYRGRRRAARKRRIIWEETVARHDAAGLVQGCWRRRRNARFLLQLAQETGKARVAPGKVCEAIPATGAFASAEPTTRATEAALSAPVSVPPVESQLRPDAIDTADSVVETEATKPAVGLTRTIEPREQRPQAAELDTSSLFELWSAFTSLLAAAGTRLAVRRAIASALLAPAAATMANISRVRRRAASSGAYPPSSPPSGLVVPPNPASFDCALSFERDVAVAGRRIAGMVRARGGLLSAAIAAGTKIIGGGAEEEEEGGGVQGVRSGEDEVEDLVLEAVQGCWELLSSSNSPLAGIDEAVIQERLTEILSTTIQNLMAELSTVALRLSAQNRSEEESERHAVDISGDTPLACSSLEAPKPLDATLVRALASSATTSILSHPDAAEFIPGTSYDTGDDAEPVFPGGYHYAESENYATLVGEVYGTMLAAPCGCMEDYGGYSLRDRIRGRSESLSGTNDKRDSERGDTDLNDIREPPEIAPASSPPSPPPCLRGQERFYLLQSIARKIDQTAEELLRMMEASNDSDECNNQLRQEGVEPRRGRPSGGNKRPSSSTYPVHYENVVRPMTDGLWELALTVSPRPMDLYDDARAVEEEEVLRVDKAARRVQGWWLRWLWGRRRQKEMRRKITASTTIIHWYTRRRRGRQIVVATGSRDDVAATQDESDIAGEKALTTSEASGASSGHARTDETSDISRRDDATLPTLERHPAGEAGRSDEEIHSCGEKNTDRNSEGGSVPSPQFSNSLVEHHAADQGHNADSKHEDCYTHHDSNEDLVVPPTKQRREDYNVLGVEAAGEVGGKNEFDLSPDKSASSIVSDNTARFTGVGATNTGTHATRSGEGSYTACSNSIVRVDIATPGEMNSDTQPSAIAHPSNFEDIAGSVLAVGMETSVVQTSTPGSSPLASGGDPSFSDIATSIDSPPCLVRDRGSHDDPARVPRTGSSVGS